MNTRLKTVWAVVKSALSRDDFGDWESWVAWLGQKKSSGEILWNEWSKQREQYKGTTYACIRKIAPAVAAAPLHLYVPKGSGSIREAKRIPVADEVKIFLLTRPHCKAIMTVNEEMEEITQHPGLSVFTSQGSSMSRYQVFDMTMVDMSLNGNCYWRPILNQAEAYPAEISFLPAALTEPTKNGGRVAGYKVKQKDGTEIKFKLEEVVHFWYPNPHSDCQGFSPVSAASQRISGESLTSTFQNSTLKNMGMPAAMVKIMRRMKDEEFQEFKRGFQGLFGGPDKANKMGFTQGDEWTIEKLGQTLQEMGYIEGAKMLREFIANDFQVPLSKLTMESSNRAVAEAGNTEFLRDTILPNLTMIAEELTHSLIPMFDSLKDTGAFYMFENPVPEDIRTKIMKRRVNRTTGVTTPNEERQEDGLDPHPSEEAESLAPVRAAIPEQGEPEKQAVDAVIKAIEREGALE
jgi:HK97 family phage portal protein